MKFTDLPLIEPLLRAVREEGYENPSPIQAKAIPPLLQGRDLLGCAQTGTGKTAAFALPILQLLSEEEVRGFPPIRALILTPTRELALQIGESFAAYGRHLPLRCVTVFGGVSQNPQVQALAEGVDILVATPGRLNDLIGQGYIDLSCLELFVLDEADRMLDMGFIHDVRRVLQKLPPQRQTLLFSATMPKEIAELADGMLTDPVKVAVTPVSSTVDLIEQKVYFTDKVNKRRLLLWVLQDPDIWSALVFTRTKHGADRVAKELVRNGIGAQAIHGDKSQGARQRALGDFKAGKIRVLVATDIAARGIDIEELTHVINFEIPNEPETYVHRIGRTGRAGAAGTALSFCDFEEKAYLADIEKLIKKKITAVEEHPYPMEIFEVLPKPERPPRPSKEERMQRQAEKQARQQAAKAQRQKQAQQPKPQQAAAADAAAPKRRRRRKPKAKQQTQ